MPWFKKYLENILYTIMLYSLSSNIAYRISETMFQITPNYYLGNVRTVWTVNPPQGPNCHFFSLYMQRFDADL